MASINYNFYSFIKSPDTRKIIAVIVIAFLLIAIPLTVYFVQQQQTVRQHAAPADLVHEYSNGLGGAWDDKKGFTQVPTSGYYTLSICKANDTAVWDDAWAHGCPNPNVARSWDIVAKYLFRFSQPCSHCGGTPPDFYDQIYGVGDDGNNHLKSIDSVPGIFPDKSSTCTLWQIDTSTGGRHSYGNRTGCNAPLPTPTPTTKPTSTPTPQFTLTPTPTITPTLTPTMTPTLTPTGAITPTMTLTPTPTGIITPTVTVTGTPAPTLTPTPTPTGAPILTPTPTPNTPLVINQPQPTQQPAATRVPTQVASGSTVQTVGLITAGTLLILIGGILILL